MATPPEKTTPVDSSTSSQGNRPSYADRDLRITKENLYMVLALWMESFPVEQEENMADGSSSEASQEHASVPPEENSQNQPEITPKTSPYAENDSYKSVGAVLVLPNGMIHAVDCSRNGVHGVARLLMAHQDILQDCNVFVSRKPCSLCAKLLVQSKVKRVFFLPIEPEYHVDKEEGEKEKSKKDKKEKFENKTSCIDNLFKVSEISQTVFVPRAGKEALVNTEKKYQTPKTIRDEIKERLLDLYWKEEWMASAKYDLPWPAFDDNMKMQVHNDFEGIMEWMASILVEAKKGYVFKAVKALPTHSDENLPFNPEGNDHERKQAEHLITLAKFLAERTDDPAAGVGAVITNKEMDIVGLGWNGFPSKALYGEFPRASKKDNATPDKKKYPYIIHAEQNALLMRNTKNITGATLFVTKTPCNECTPLIEMQGIKTVVLGEKMKEKKEVDISYTEFPEKVRKDVFICFEMESVRSLGDKPSPTLKVKKSLTDL